MIKKSETVFIEMIEQCSGIINSLCRTYNKNPSDIKDARQDIILQLWKSYPTFKNDAKVSTWVYRVGINTLLNRQRKSGKMDMLNIDTFHESADPKFNIYCDDDLSLLKQLLDLLPDIDKSIMILHLEGYKYAEIADITNLTITNISTRISRIKKRLSDIFKKDTYEY